MFTLPPELALALFVAPVLLDAAYDASLRDLRDNWAPVTRQVEVEVLHRDDLGVAATRGAALDPEHGAERRLADRDRRAAPDAVETLREPDGRRRLALAQRRRADRRDDDVLAARVRRLDATDAVERDLGLGAAVELDLVLVQAEIAGNVEDRPRRDRPGDARGPRGRTRWRSWTTPGELADAGPTAVAGLGLRRANEMGEQQRVGHAARRRRAPA